MRGRLETLRVEELALPDIYPRDLTSVIPLRLPLAFLSISKLSTTSLQEWLTRRGISSGGEGQYRRLHGALVARAGRGIVFIESNDEMAEQRFTAAHETAHFLEDHVAPRLKALKAFGETIRPVLDGKRPPTAEESVSSVLNRAPLGVQVHLMARGPTGGISHWDVEEREQRADRLALEIVAPASAARQVLRRVVHPDGTCTMDAAAAALSQHFGLPTNTACSYATMLFREGRSRPRLSETLLGAKR